MIQNKGSDYAQIGDIMHILATLKKGKHKSAVAHSVPQWAVAGALVRGP